MSAHVLGGGVHHEVRAVLEGAAQVGCREGVVEHQGQTGRVRDVGHLRWLRRELGDDMLDAAVITTGPQAYRRRDGIAVIPAALLGP